MSDLGKLLDDLDAAREKATAPPARRLVRHVRNADELRTYLLERSEPAGDESGCRLWLGPIGSKGYARIKHGGKSVQVHVLAHELWIGPVPSGLEIDHVADRGCRHRHCIAPSHLEAVTHAENVRRATAQRKHCSRGHEYRPETTRTQIKRGVPCRRCLVCKRTGNQAYKQRLRAARGVAA